MIELTNLDNDIKLDIRYATESNFLGKKVYQEARAFLQKESAFSLLNAHLSLKDAGLGLLIFDGYRPWSVTKVFWESVAEHEKKYVADPAVGSRHNRGCAVDLTMYELKSGEPVDMPSDFDEFNEKAHPFFDGCTSTQKQNRNLLISTMSENGFSVNPNEWWHFDHYDWEKFEILDLAFDEIPAD